MEANSKVQPRRPKLRGDLIVSQQGGPDAASCVVKDPVTERFFRFRQVEGYILRQFDGATALDEVRQHVQQTFAVTVSTATMEQFVDKLSRLGLLTEEGVAGGERLRPAERVRGNLFYLRLRAFDPDRFLAWLDGHLRFCFTPGFVTGSGALVLLAAGITVANWPEIADGLRHLWNVQSLVLAWLVVMLVIAAHELAHGVACKHFGGTVHELGFLLLYFQPTCYCNVSDAWLFPEKSKRLWVTFAGAYFEIVLWAVATTVWRLTDFSTAINHLALVVMSTSGVKTLFNLNPLIKLDGYYMLSDALEIPNLRGKAMEYLKARLRGQAAPMPQGRTYVVYGVLAWVYSVWLLALVANWIGGRLIGQYQAWGFFAFAGLLAAVFWRPLVTGFGRIRDASMKKHGKILAIIVVGGGILFFTRTELRVSGGFEVLPAHNSDIRAEVAGIIEEVRFDEGDSVVKDEVVARLSERDNRAESRKVKAQIEEKQAQLRMLRAGPRQEEIAVAKIVVEKGTERVRYAKNQLDMLKGLYAQNLVSRKEFQAAEEEVAIRQKELEEADGNLRLMLAGSRPEEIEATEAEIARLDVQQHYLQDELDRINLVSPIDGVITTPKLKEKIGQHVNKGDLVATVHALKTVIAEISVSEKEISDVKVGQIVVLKARAYPQRVFEGKVTAIAPTVTKGKDENKQTDRTVTVTTQLDNGGLLLKPEMTGTAKIYCGKRRLLDLVTRRFSRYLRVEFWSWW
jgi:putative peptide zinc metalloprotease protein